MKSISYQCATIRFRPNRIKGEFANIGVMACASSGSEFGYRLAGSSDFARVLDFFPEIERNTLQNAIEHLQVELESYHEFERDQSFFRKVLEPRDGSIQFGESGLVVADSLDAALDQIEAVSLSAPAAA